MNANSILAKGYEDDIVFWPKNPKANFQNGKMNISYAITKHYENVRLHRRGETKPNSKPIKANSNPIQTQSNPISKAHKGTKRREEFLPIPLNALSISLFPAKFGLFSLLFPAGLQARSSLPSSPMPLPWLLLSRSPTLYPHRMCLSGP